MASTQTGRETPESVAAARLRKAMADRAAARQKTEGSVSVAVEALRKAIIACDGKALQNLTLPTLSYGHSSGKLETQNEFIDAIVSGKSGFSAIDLTGQTVKMVENVALVRHVFTGTRKKGGDQVKLYILTIWMRRGAQWKLLARQATKWDKA